MRTKAFWVFVCLVFASCIIGAVVYKQIVFDINVKGHLKRAADANTVSLAKQEMGIAILYLENNHMTEGYTSVIYKTPDEDIGFWYSNLKSSLYELNKVSEEATQLESSNILMKLRETLLDGNIVIVPQAIHLFPYNIAYAICMMFACGCLLWLLSLLI